MKKLTSLLLSLLLIFSLAACSKAEGNDNGGNNSQNSSQSSVQSETNNVQIADSTELLTKVWDLFPEDQRFMAMGGDSENLVDGAPGAFNLAKAEELGIQSVLCFPTTELSKIDNAASLVHGMLANNFTAGAYHVADVANTNSLVQAIKDTTVNNQWMCGFPETLLIATVGDDYVVSAFGSKDIMENFKGALSQAYPDAVTVVAEEALAE